MMADLVKVKSAIKSCGVGFLLLTGLCLPTQGICENPKHANHLRLELKSVGSSNIELRLINDGPRGVNVLTSFVTGGNLVDFEIKDASNNTVRRFGPVGKLEFSSKLVVLLGKDEFFGVVKDLRDLQEFPDIKVGYKLNRGKYRVKAVYEVPDSFKSYFKDETIWIGTITSNEIEVVIE